VVGEAAFVAHPVVIDLGVVPRHEAPGALVLVLDLDVAAGRAAVAHARRSLELPRPHREPEVLRGQRTNRADIDGVDRVRVVELLARRRGQDLVVTAMRELELVLARDHVARADAARAQDAALLIEHDVRSEIDDLVLVDLVGVDARIGVVVIEVQLLQRALAGLVADRAIDRMVDERELELLLARERRRRIGRVHDHAFADDLLAARLQLRILLDRDQALAALGDDRQAGVITKRADVVTEELRCLEDVRALRHRDRLSINGECY